MIGVYLVFASLIFPALAVVNQKKGKMLAGIIISVISYFVGLLCSYMFDWPAGPAIIFVMAVIATIVFVLRRTGGTFVSK